METMEEQEAVFGVVAFQLVCTDPSGIRERKLAAMDRIDEVLDQAKERGIDDLSVFEPFRAASDALMLLDKEEIDIENGYRVRLFLEPKPYPWEGLE